MISAQMGAKPRIRRTAADAQTAILDAAEAQLARSGPDSLRLQQIAAEVGMSHSAILHHFGSRKGLVKAVLARTGERLQTQVFSLLEGPVDQSGAAVLLDRLFRSMRETGTARLMVWLFLAQDDAVDPVGYGDRLRSIAEVVHARRLDRSSNDEQPQPSFDDTLYTVMLAGLVMFGDAVAGRAMRASAGLPERADTEVRFTAWLAKLLHTHLDAH